MEFNSKWDKYSADYCRQRYCHADNVVANAGSGGSTFATDDVGGVQFPRTKITIGADGTNDGDVSAANPLPVTGTITAVTALTNALPAGTNAIGKLAANSGVDIGDVDVTTLPAITIAGAQTLATVTTVGAVTAITNALPAGANAIGKLAANSGVDIGDVDVTTVGTITPGTAATSLGKAEDAGHASGDVGVMALTVRQNTAAALSGTDADYQPLITDTNGRLHVLDANSAAALTSLQLIDDVVFAEDAAHASGDKGIMALAVQKNADAALQADGDYSPLQVDANGYLKVNIKAGAGSGGTASTDDGAFTAASGSGTPIMGFATSDAVDSGDVGVLQMDTSRRLVVAPGAAEATISATAGVKVFLFDAADTQITSFSGGTQYTEDAAAAANPVGPIMMGRRKDTLSTSEVSADGDNIAANFNSRGEQYVVIDPRAGTIAHAEDVAAADGDVGVSVLAVRRDTVAVGSGTDGDYSTLNVNASGRLYTSATIDTALPAGTNAIGKLSANTGVTIGAVEIAAAQTLATVTTVSTVTAVTNVATIGTSVTPGSAAANLGKAEDAAHASGDVGVMSLAVRSNTAASTSGTDGDYQPLITNTTGHLWVDASGQTLTVASHAVTVASGGVASGAIASGAVASGAVASGAFASGALASGSIAAGAIAAGATSIADNEDVASADGDRGVKVLFKRTDTPANASGTTGDYEQPQMSGGYQWVHDNKGLSNLAFSAAFTTLTRPANTTAYTAGDSISDNATAGSVTALTATIADVNDDPIFISEILLHSTDTGLAGKKVRAYLYNSDPTASTGVVGGDNAAFSNKKAGYIGMMQGWMETGFSDGSVGRLVPTHNDATNYPGAGGFVITKPTSGAKTLFIQYQAVEAFTPSANSTTLIGTARGWQGRAV